MVVIAKELCVRRKAMGHRNGRIVVAPQEFLGSGIGRLPAYPGRYFNLKLGRDSQQSAIKRAIVNRVEAQAIPRVSSIAHVYRPRHDVACGQ